MKRILTIFMVMLLVAVAVPSVVTADTAQRWYLSDDDPRTGADYTMYKATNGGGSVVTIGDGQSKVWTADDPAEVNVGFPTGQWSYKVTTTSDNAAGELIFLDVGHWDGSFFHDASGSGAVVTDPDSEYTGSFWVGSFTVPTDKWLAYRIENALGSGTVELDVTEPNSYLESPSSDPGYPIPELPTIVLLTTGLVGLAGYLGLKRHNRVYLKA